MFDSKLAKKFLAKINTITFQEIDDLPCYFHYALKQVLEEND